MCEKCGDTITLPSGPIVLSKDQRLTVYSPTMTRWHYIRQMFWEAKLSKFYNKFAKFVCSKLDHKYQGAMCVRCNYENMRYWIRTVPGTWAVYNARPMSVGFIHKL